MFETTSIPAIPNGKPLARPCQKSPGDHAVPPASKAFPPGCWTSSCPVARLPEDNPLKSVFLLETSSTWQKSTQRLLRFFTKRQHLRSKAAASFPYGLTLGGSIVMGIPNSWIFFPIAGIQLLWYPIGIPILKMVTRGSPKNWETP